MKGQKVAEECVGMKGGTEELRDRGTGGEDES